MKLLALSLIISALVALISGPLAAQETEKAIPTGYPITRYSAIWEDSPFDREVVAAVETRFESNFGRNLVLEGLVNDSKRGPMAFLRDTKENVPFLVTTQTGQPPYAYQLVEADTNPDPMKTKVKITDGNETAEIGFESNVLTSKIATPPPANPQAENAAAAAREAALARQERFQRDRESLNQAPADSNSEDNSPDADALDPIDRLDEGSRRRNLPLPTGSAR